MREIPEKQEQVEKSVATTKAEEADHYEKRKVAQAKLAEVAELEAKAAEIRKAAQAEKAEADHKIASTKVAKLFNETLTEFEKNLTRIGDTKNTLFGKYYGIQSEVKEIQKYDSDFPQSLAKGKYSNAVSMRDRRIQFWAHHLPAIANGQLPLHKFLLQGLAKSESPLVVSK